MRRGESSGGGLDAIQRRREVENQVRQEENRRQEVENRRRREEDQRRVEEDRQLLGDRVCICVQFQSRWQTW